MAEDRSTTQCDDPPDGGTTVVQRAHLTIDAPATLADSAETVDRLDRAAASPETIDAASRSSALLRESRGPASAETVESSSILSAPLEETGVFAPASRPDSAVDIFAESPGAAGQAATVADGAIPSDATSDGTEPGESWERKNLPAFLAQAATGARNEPPDYEIIQALGRGGMGIVYKARHRGLNRLVALKMIRGAYADEIQIARFKIEAEAVAALRHPNILQIYDIGEFNGAPYVALELLEGGSLSEKLFGTTLSPRQAAEWMVPLVMAMDTAHRAGIVHRDLKSANILFTADGIPKITDFGLAKRLESDDGQTHTGQVMGTPSYMAPEQARGDTKSAGPPADIYALGAILYEMLAGRPPFKGSSAIETVKQVIEQDPISPSRVQFRVPRDLETICMKCLQKEPRKRYATAKDLADDLKRYLAGEPIRARRTPPLERAAKWIRRNPTKATLSGLAATALLSLIGAGLWYVKHQRDLEHAAAQYEAGVLKASASDVILAQEAISKHDLNEAQRILASRKALLERENNRAFAGMYGQTTRMLDDVEKALDVERARQAEQLARNEIQKEYRRFLDLRKQALFWDTQFTGLALSASADLTRKAAEDALSIFARGKGSDDWELGQLPAALSSQQKAEVADGCYELLLVLAEAVSGQADRALRVLDGANRLRPGGSRAYHLRRAACLARKDDQAAQARELSLADKAHPETAFDFFLSGKEQYKAKHYTAAIEDLGMALRKNPDHFWAKCLLAICHIQNRSYDTANAYLIDCIEADPEFAWLYLLRGFACGELGAVSSKLADERHAAGEAANSLPQVEFDHAEADFQQALELLKRAPDDELHYILLVNRGLVRFQRGELAQAEADYREAIRLKKDSYVAYAELAHVHQQRGEIDQAIEQFSRAIAVEPNLAALYRGRAALHQALGERSPKHRARAAEDLKMAILHEKPDNQVLAQDHTQLARLLFVDERFEDVLGECKLALSAMPEYPEAHVLQIRALLNLRRFDDVIRSCDAALSTKVRNSAVLYELRALAQEAHNDYPGAIRDYNRAIEIRPDDGRLLVERGWAYLLFESPKPALVDFERALKLDAADSDALCGRGMAQARLGDYRAAIADANLALRYGMAIPRVNYNAARIYATAADAAAAEMVRASRTLSFDYQDIAVRLVQKAFEKEAPGKRAAFWRDTVRSDPALKAIQRRLKYEDLVTSSKKPGS